MTDHELNAFEVEEIWVQTETRWVNVSTDGEVAVTAPLHYRTRPERSVSSCRPKTPGKETVYIRLDPAGYGRGPGLPTRFNTAIGCNPAVFGRGRLRPAPAVGTVEFRGVNGSMIVSRFGRLPTSRRGRCDATVLSAVRPASNRHNAMSMISRSSGLHRHRRKAGHNRSRIVRRR